MPGGDKNIRPEDGKQFSSTYQPLNRGRKPLVTTQILNELHEIGYTQLTKEDVRRVYRTLLNMPVVELQHMSSNAGMDVPVIFRTTAAHILSKHGFNVIETMLNRAFGKPINTLQDILDPENTDDDRTVLVIEIPNNPLLKGETVDYEEIASKQLEK